jgi:hypothetical protein
MVGMRIRNALRFVGLLTLAPAASGAQQSLGRIGTWYPRKRGSGKKPMQRYKA